ncbi:GAF domain-containing protein [Halovenus salina]|uniref:GAF domain-containing protein n=1 Tax=Halovenus salina TaxID=1510225 RepID=A0ABD5W2V4_9EURY
MTPGDERTDGSDRPPDSGRLHRRRGEKYSGYDYTAVRFADEDEGVLEPVALTPEVTEVLGDRPSYLIDGDSPHAEVYTEGERLRFDEVRDIDDDHGRDPVRSAMYLPIGEHGMVTICDPEPGVFDRSDIEIASVLVANAETALDRQSAARR